MDYLVCFVLFPIQELLVLSPDQLDCLVTVIRSLDPSRHLFLQSLESIAFSNCHVELLTFGCRDIGLYPEIKTYFLSVSLLFFEILSIDEACYLQVVSVGLFDQIRVGQFVGGLELVSGFVWNVTARLWSLRISSANSFLRTYNILTLFCIRS